jgi:hypothetical protein
MDEQGGSEPALGGVVAEESPAVRLLGAGTALVPAAEPPSAFPVAVPLADGVAAGSAVAWRGTPAIKGIAASNTAIRAA